MQSSRPASRKHADAFTRLERRQPATRIMPLALGFRGRPRALRPRRWTRLVVFREMPANYALLFGVYTKRRCEALEQREGRKMAVDLQRCPCSQVRNDLLTLAHS